MRPVYRSSAARIARRRHRNIPAFQATPCLLDELLGAGGLRLLLERRGAGTRGARRRRRRPRGAGSGSRTRSPAATTWMPSVTSASSVAERARREPRRGRPEHVAEHALAVGPDAVVGRAARSSPRRRGGRCRRWRGRWRRRCCARPARRGRWRPGAAPARAARTAGPSRPSRARARRRPRGRRAGGPSPGAASRRRAAGGTASGRSGRESGHRRVPPPPAITTTYIGPFYGPGAARHGPRRAHRATETAPNRTNLEPPIATARARIRTIGRSTALTRSPRLRTIRERSQEGRPGPTEPRSALDHVGDAGLAPARAPATITTPGAAATPTRHCDPRRVRARHRRPPTSRSSSVTKRFGTSSRSTR